ncbi:DUF4411 family protein [Psychromarinibacter sediminicola]
MGIPNRFMSVGKRSKKRVKIPDVCDDLGVRNMLVFDMLRKVGFSA